MKNYLFLFLLMFATTEGMFTDPCQKMFETRDLITGFASNLYNLDRSAAPEVSDTICDKYKAFLAGGCNEFDLFYKSVKGIDVDSEIGKIMAVFSDCVGDNFKIVIRKTDFPGKIDLTQKEIKLGKTASVKYNGFIRSPVMKAGSLRDVIERSLSLDTTLSYISYFPDYFVIHLDDIGWLNSLQLTIGLAEFRLEDGKKTDESDSRYTYDFVGAVCVDTNDTSKYFFILKDQRGNGEWITNEGGVRYSYDKTLTLKVKKMIEKRGILFFYQKQGAATERRVAEERAREQGRMLNNLAASFQQILVQEEKK